MTPQPLTIFSLLTKNNLTLTITSILFLCVKQPILILKTLSDSWLTIMEDQSYLLLGKLKLEYGPTQTQELTSEISEHEIYTT
jgi:hypothetical protein